MIIDSISMPCTKGYNSNNSSSEYAILTQYRRHLHVAYIPDSIMARYTGADIVSAIYSFRQLKVVDNHYIYVRSYWTYYNSTTCPFAAGVAEDVGTNADAWPNTTAEQPQHVHYGSVDSSNLPVYNVDLTKIFKYIFDKYNPDPASTATNTYGIWSRFGRSGYTTGSTTNLGSFALTITVTDGKTFVFKDGSWQSSEPSCRVNGEWISTTPQLRLEESWQNV